MSALYRVITRTYLEMRQRSEFSPVQNGDARIRIEKIGNCPTSFFRYLYREVGRNYDWVDRLDRWKEARRSTAAAGPGFDQASRSEANRIQILKPRAGY